MANLATLYAYAVAVGLVSAGLAGSLWALATGRDPGLQLLRETGRFVPIRAMAVVVYAPLAMLRAGFSRLFNTPAFGAVLIAASLGWSFLQGVFILTQIFGLK